MDVNPSILCWCQGIYVGLLMSFSVPNSENVVPAIAAPPGKSKIAVADSKHQPSIIERVEVTQKLEIPRPTRNNPGSPGEYRIK